MSETVQIKAPWLASKDPEVPSTLNYSTLSMCGRVEEMVRQYPNYIAYEFMGKTTTYAEMWQKINACAKSLKAIGIPEGRTRSPSVCPTPLRPCVCSTP